MSQERDSKLEQAISELKPKQKQLVDVMFSTADSITRIHQLRNIMMNAISSPDYLAQLTPKEWADINNSLNESENVAGTFLNEQARIAEKAPSTIQNVYAILAGGNVQQNNTVNQVEQKPEYEIPKEIAPLRQAIQSTLDAKFGLNRGPIIEANQENNGGNNDTSS